jgi:hypothetical protein
MQTAFHLRAEGNSRSAGNALSMQLRSVIRPVDKPKRGIVIVIFGK